MSPLLPNSRLSGLDCSRRRFVQGLVTGGVMASLPAWASAAPVLRTPASTTTGSAPVLTGQNIDLVIAESWVNYTGTPQLATTINGSLPAPTLRLREGDEVSIRVTNHLRESSSLHWHGILLPYQMDGVPGISFSGIAPGETFVYRFRLQQSGTYWYHAHSGMQELTGLYGALIVEPRQGDRFAVEQDHVVLLSDWIDGDPMRAFNKLRKQGDIYNFHQPTVGDFFRDMNDKGWAAAWGRRRMWQQMRMNPTDLSDLSSAVLTYLMNGVTPAGNWHALFKKGDCVRLRFINGSGNSFYDVRIPGLKMTVIQADGVDVEPVTVDEFRFGPGETYDVLLRPEDDAYTVFAQSMDRSGYACGTLSTRPELQAAVPALDPVEWLTMSDMMGNMQHGDMSHHGMSHQKMMHHGGMAMDHSMHGMAMNPLAVPSQKVRHASTEYGASVDMRVDTPRSNLDDPGIGLRNNGRRVLTLADLSTIGGPLDARMPEREIELHLTGNMERYSWSIDGLEFGQSRPVALKQGERVRIILQNDTMMTHPMHMHGFWSELENDKGEFVARKHTLPIQPAQRISYLLTADALGRWAWHCHLMFHMDAGMFREVLVS